VNPQFAFRVYFPEAETGATLTEFADLPVARPCAVVIHLNQSAARALAERLIAAIADVIKKMGGAVVSKGPGSWKELPDDGVNCLHVVVCEGTVMAEVDAAVLETTRRSSTSWILPVLNKKASDSVSTLLDAELRKRNIAFWEADIAELALVALARAGVTSLDRRVFISYRRVETSPLADQLFDRLSQRNFQVFLDRVSVDPGVDFQVKLFEHLADKSMMVLLHSTTFASAQWTKAEIDFARDLDLSILVLRLPGLPNDINARAGEVVQLEESEIEMVRVAETDRARLSANALEKVVDQIVYQHDLDLIGRLRNLRDRVIAAVDRNDPKLSYSLSRSNARVDLEVRSGGGSMLRYALHPSFYPAGLPDLFDASAGADPRNKMNFVVGHSANLAPLRARHLDWAIGGRNVGYHDIKTVNGLVDLMAKGEV
jgi:hypothetical protein